MTTRELLEEVYRNLASRNLKNPSIRRNAACRIVKFMETTGQFMDGQKVIFPADKRRVLDKYAEFKGGQPSGAENHAIKIMDDILSAGSVENKAPIHASLSQKFRPESLMENECAADAHQIENKLLRGTFYPVDSIGQSVPDASGLYCIKLRGGAVLPGNFWQLSEDRIIYIGKASKSLYRRLWEEELNGERPATFFRSIGAMLGYLPKKGSLYGKPGCNYKFDSETETKIRKWMRQSLLVSFVEVERSRVAELESHMIGKCRPIMNIQGNPDASEYLKQRRAQCLKHARSNPD